MKSLRNRLTLALSLVLIGAGALLALGLQDFPRRLVEDYVRSRLEHDADLLYARVLDAPDPAAAVGDAAGTVYRVPLSGHYFVVRRGTELFRSRSLWDEDLRLPDPPPADETALRLPGPAGQPLLVLIKRAPERAGTEPILVAVAEDVSTLDAAITRFRGGLLIGLLAALAVLVVLQRRLLVRGLAPLDDAVEACRRLERGEEVAVDTRSPSEVQPMLDAVNRLARHHAQRLGRIRHAAGNLSHALKTPLAVLAQRTDDLRARGEHALADEFDAQLALMRDTIERELRRARLAGGGPPGSGFDVRAQLEALADAVMRLHDERIAIELDLPERHAPLDKEDMLELFGNLLDNACKWARSRVRLRIAPAAEAADALVFRVEDDGPGVPDELLGQLGTAGLRVDEGRPGHGIGLVIVGDIVGQYGGTLRYGRSALGGLQVDGRLPYAAQPA